VGCALVAHEVKVKLLAVKAYPGNLAPAVQELIDIVIQRYLLRSVRLDWYIV
jgi:flagella basal body P-ring formation protein FlgA